MLRHAIILVMVFILGISLVSCSGNSNPVSGDDENTSRIMGITFPTLIQSLIAFSRYIPDDENIYGMNSELFVINQNGMYEHQITFNHADDDFPAWSPNGHMIAYTSNVNSGGYGSHDIYRLGPVGIIQQLTDETWQWDTFHTQWPIPMAIIAARLNTLVGAPFDVGQVIAISPWGNWQTFVDTGHIMAYDPTASGTSRNIAFCARPQGATYMDDIELYLKPPWLDYSYRITYFGDESEDPWDLVFTTDPDFDPTGQKIIFQTTYWDDNTEIGMVDLTTADAIPQPYRLTFDKGADLEPAWDPTGQYFIWVTNRDGNFEIYKQKYVDPNSDQPQPEPVRLTYTPEDEHNPEWGPIYNW